MIAWKSKCSSFHCGTRAGQSNPNFLNADAFIKLVLQPYRDARFGPHTGPFLFEFERHGLSLEEFFGGLDRFLPHLPGDVWYAVEIRNAD
jgi:hypothetical protein